MSLNRLNALEQSTSRLHADVSRLLQLAADHGDHISELHDNLGHMVSKKELEVAVGTSNFLIQALHEKVNKLLSAQDDQDVISVEFNETKNVNLDSPMIAKRQLPKDSRSHVENSQPDAHLLKRLDYLENELNDAKSQIFHLNSKVHQLEHNLAAFSSSHHNSNIQNDHEVAHMNHEDSRHDSDSISEKCNHNSYQNNLQENIEGNVIILGSNSGSDVSNHFNIEYFDEAPEGLTQTIKGSHVEYMGSGNVESDTIEAEYFDSVITQSNDATKESKNGPLNESPAYIGGASDKLEYTTAYNELHDQPKFSHSNSLVNSTPVVSMQQEIIYGNNDKILAIEAIIAANRQRLESYGVRTEKIQNNVKLMDAEHSALLLSHKNLMSRFTDSEAAIYAILDKLMNITDCNQANAERQELHAIEQAKQIKSAMEKITVLTKRMNNPHLNNFGNMPTAPEQTRRSSAVAPMLGLPELKEFDDEPTNSNNNNSGDSQITSIEFNRLKAKIKELGDHQVSVVSAVKTLNEKLFSMTNNRHLPENNVYRSAVVTTNVASNRLDLSGHPDIIDLRNDVDVLKRRMVLLPRQIYHQLFHEEIRRQSERVAALKIRSDQSVTVKSPINPCPNKSKYHHARGKLLSKGVKHDIPSNAAYINNSHGLVDAPILPISSKIRKLIEKKHSKGHHDEAMIPTRPSSSHNIDHKLNRFYQKLDDSRQLDDEIESHRPAHSSGGSEYDEMNVDDIFTRSVYEDEGLDEFDPGYGYPENRSYMHGHISNFDATISEITFTEMDLLHELSTALTSSVLSSSKS